MFTTYLELGIKHILDIDALDHLYFIVLIAISYPNNKWKNLLWLVTAFTIGHSLSLFLSGIGWININPQIIESLIGVTILAAAVPNYLKATKIDLSHSLHYLVVCLFGVIHGLGFSNFFKAINSPGDSIFIPLISFNIGVEIGQLVIIGCTFLFMYLCTEIFKLSERGFKLVLTTIIVMLVLKMILG